jgi:hypothetical protein
MSPTQEGSIYLLRILHHSLRKHSELHLISCTFEELKAGLGEARKRSGNTADKWVIRHGIPKGVIK